jgi:hypothetical protein
MIINGLGRKRKLTLSYHDHKGLGSRFASSSSIFHCGNPIQLKSIPRLWLSYAFIVLAISHSLRAVFGFGSDSE